MGLLTDIACWGVCRLRTCVFVMCTLCLGLGCGLFCRWNSCWNFLYWCFWVRCNVGVLNFGFWLCMFSFCFGCFCGFVVVFDLFGALDCCFGWWYLGWVCALLSLFNDCLGLVCD